MEHPQTGKSEFLGGRQEAGDDGHQDGDEEAVSQDQDQERVDQGEVERVPHVGVVADVEGEVFERGWEPPGADAGLDDRAIKGGQAAALGVEGLLERLAFFEADGQVAADLAEAAQGVIAEAHQAALEGEAGTHEGGDLVVERDPLVEGELAAWGGWVGWLGRP